MHIKDHSAAMKFFRTYDNVASKGKWKEFVDEMEFDSMIQEPRTMVADASTEMEQFPDSYLRPKRYDILTGLDVPAETLEDWDTSFRNPNAQGGRIGLKPGGIVEPGVMYYGTDRFSKKEKLKQGRIYTTHGGKRTLDLTKEQNKWFNKTHKNNPDSRFYKKDWHDLGGKKADLLDSYYNELAREKPPKGYITTKEFSKKYDFPIYEKRQYGPITKAESNFINNALMKQLYEKDVAKGRKNLLLKKFLTETLEPRQFETLLDLGDGKKSVKKVNYIKDSPKLAKKVRTYLDSPFVQVKTRENMTKILKNNKIKTLFNKGDYKGLVKALEGVKGLTNAERANALLRVSQAMSGVSFRDFEHNLKSNKPSANKIFRGLEKAKWGDPYADAYKDLKRTTIKNAIGDEYFTKSYRGFIDDAKKALNNSGIDTRALKLDLNEITGLSAGYKNKTFSSTQFVNFMDSKFNSEQHASMIKEYGRHETKLQSALKGKNPSEARQVVKDWETWRKGWYNKLDDKFKTKAIRDILPTFTLGKDPYAKVLSKKRLSELAGLDFNIREEGIKSGYGKTFKSIKKQPILREVAMGNKNAIKFVTTFSGTFQDLSPQSVLQMGNEFDCLNQQKGGSVMRCLQTKFKADPEKFLQRSAPLAKGNPNLLKWFKRGRNIARGTGVFALWEAAFAPLLMGWMATEGESWDRMKHDLAYGPLFEAIGVSPKFVPGISVKEEFMEAAGGDEKVYAAKRIDEIGQELPLLQQQLNAAINEYAHVEGKGYKQHQIEKMIKAKEQELQGYLNIPEFYEGPAGEYVDVPTAGGVFTKKDEVLAKIEADKKAQLEEYREKGYVAPENWWQKQNQFQYRLPQAGGGLTRTVAPDSEGIMSLKKW